MTTTEPAARRSEESATISVPQAEAERVLAEVFEHSPEVFLWVDPDRSIRYFNRTAAGKALAVHGRELRRGDAIDHFLRPADREEFDKHFRCALDGEATRVERCFRAGAETLHFDVEYEPMRADGAVRGVCFTVSDVTASKRAAGALVHEADLVQRIFDATDANVTVVGPDGKLVRVNAAWRRFAEENGAGDERTWGVGADYYVRVDPARGDTTLAGEAEDGVRKVQRGDLPRFSIEGAYHHPNGERRWYSLRALPIAEPKGTVLVAYVDITATVAASEALRETERTQRLLERQLLQAQKRDSLAVMAAGIAHKLNNLLGAIQGNLELARGEVSPAVEGMLADAERAAQQAAAVSAGLLTYLGEDRHPRRPGRLEREVTALLPYLRTARLPGVQLALQLDGGLPVCAVDPAELRVVVINLVTNASEAIAPAGGTVRIAARRVSEWPAEAGLEPATAHGARAWACLEVSDDGPGMDAATRDRLFEPFFTTKSTGRGLGLSVAQGIVRASGGAIVVESALGRGTTVRVYLPEVRRGEVPEAPEAPEWPGTRVAHRPLTPTPAPAGTVLLVDDDAGMLRASARMLRRLGLETVAVASGEAALAAFSAPGATIASVLLDLSMPGLDGWEVLAALRLLRPSLHVVVASGYDVARLREEPREVQPDAWLQKPYKLAELAALYARRPRA